MTVLKASGVDAFLRKRDPSIAAILVYGEEPDAVREMAAKAVTRIAGSLDDPFSVVALQDSDLSSDPARLLDEVQSLSMTGGNRVIWMRGAEQSFLKAVMPLLEGRVTGNIVVAEAGALPRTSALRAAFEKSNHAYAVPLYEGEAGESAQLIESLLKDSNLRIGEDAVHRLLELAGTSRGLVQRETEKLALYCLGGERITVEDVEAICGNDTGADPDALTDCVFHGDVEEADQLFHALLQGGTDAGRLAMVAHGHALRLEDFRIAIEKGMKPDQVVRAARPPVFFKRQRKVLAQLQVWPLADLMQAATTLAAAVLQVRQNPALGAAIADRCLLSVARKARALRSERR